MLFILVSLVPVLTVTAFILTLAIAQKDISND
jgi:hypothetical protein